MLFFFYKNAVWDEITELCQFACQKSVMVFVCRGKYGQQSCHVSQIPKICLMTLSEGSTQITVAFQDIALTDLIDMYIFQKTGFCQPRQNSFGLKKWLKKSVYFPLCGKYRLWLVEKGGFQETQKCMLPDFLAVCYPVFGLFITQKMPFLANQNSSNFHWRCISNMASREEHRDTDQLSSHFKDISE